MDVSVDGERNFAIEGEPENLLAVIGAVSSYLEDRGRAIVGIKIDDQPYEAEGLSDTLGAQPLSSFETLEVQSAAVADLVSSCLSELEEALSNLPAACHELAAVFHGENPEEGYEPFEKLAAIWEYVKSRELLVLRALDLTTDTLELDGRKLSQLHDDLNKYLQEAAEALEKQDCVALGDLLAYELAPRAEQETAISHLLMAHARERTDTA